MNFLLQHLLMNGAAQAPERDAVILGERSLSYGELDAQSDRLARALAAHGCEKGDRVAFYMTKSLASFVAIHGILKAGAAYVPLDSRAPTQRLAYILRDCGVRCLLTTPDKIGVGARLLAEGAPLEHVIAVGEGPLAPKEGEPLVVGWHEVLDQPGGAPDNACIETDLAYILYTSGSTGVPKGVMISHLNALSFVRWAVDTLGVRADDRVSNHAPLHFDLSIFDLFATFMAGGVVLPVPPGVSAFPTRQAAWIAEHAISIWYSVPSALTLMLQQGKLDRVEFPGLRMVLFAGEVFPVRFLRAWTEKVPHATFYNLYGPTEPNVITYHRVEPLEPERTQPVPIGSACANTEVFVLDEAGNPVTEPGIEGELYARGSTVAQGYWGDREKTEAVFGSNTRSPQLRDRVYRTGDVVTLQEEGTYLYVGRRDSMVKSRGYRIELGELEAVLYAQASVKEAAVVAEPDESIGNRLVAFVVLDASSKTCPAELRTRLAEALPPYMVPEEIELREELPKTSTGKIDRRELLEGRARGGDA
jgi:amino acid adenylation domain-containing protein